MVQGDVARGKMIRRMGLAGTDRTMVGIVRTVGIGAVGYGAGMAECSDTGVTTDVSEWVCVNSTSVVRAKHGRRVLP